MNPETGRRLGPYEMQSRLGGGGMGHVYRAWDARLHREVAIKLLNHDYTMPGMRERFLREARAASALNHPNICTIFDIGEQDGDPYLVMELLQGETLKDRILRQPMPNHEIVQVARETAEALGAAHSKGVIHRDVKPANIFLVEKPNGGLQAKVLDFGLAKIEGGVLGSRARTLDITTAGATVGTLAYMSPEQARGEPLDLRSDLFSLGVVMYEMATRHVPFQGVTSALVFVQLLNHPPEPVREWNDAIPRELEKIIFKLLAKERTARFQDARELELALLALERGGSGGGQGGWLRKAAAAVPLVRAQDPVARERRGRPRHASSGSREVSRETPRPVAESEGRQEQRAEARTASPVPPARETTPVPPNELLRPVARVPRGDTPPRPRAAAAPGVEKPPSGDAALKHPPFGGATPERPADEQPPAPSSFPAERLAAAEAVPFAAETEAGAAPVHSANDYGASSSIHEAARGVSGDGFAGGPVYPRNEDDLVALEPDPELDSTFPPLLEREPHRSAARHGRALALAAVTGLLVAVGSVYAVRYARQGRLTPAVLQAGDSLAVTEFENRTGDKTLDGAVAEGMRMALLQSPWLTLRGELSCRTARGLLAAEAMGSSQPAPTGALLGRKAAERVGARAYLFGAISSARPGVGPYRVQAELRDVETNQVLAAAEEVAPGLEQVTSAVDALASDIRAAAGEPRASIEAAAVPLSREASGDLEALSAFAAGDAFSASGKLLEALDAYGRAAEADPHFAQAHLRRAAIFQQLHAELASGEAARLAMVAGDRGSERTRLLAQAVYALEGTDDLLRATGILRQLAAHYPHDAEVQTTLARVLRLQGRFSEGLAAAQQAYGDDPLDAAAYLEAETALLELDRYDAALQLDQQMQHVGLPAASVSLDAAELDGNQAALRSVATTIALPQDDSASFSAARDYAVYLDNTGRIAAGLGVERDVARREAGNDALRSAAAYLLAQGAIDRALLSDCATALSLAEAADALPEGRVALFRSATTHALCGQAKAAAAMLATLERTYPQSFDLGAFAAADIKAAAALRDQDPDTALEALRPARSADMLSITPYLRGLAHVELRQFELGIVDFQTVLAHRGAALLNGDTSFPVAQAGVARAFAQSGDPANSAEAWRRLLLLWQSADPGAPLLLEARALAHSAG